MNKMIFKNFDINEGVYFKPIERPSGNILHLMSQTFEEIIENLFNSFVNNEIETIERFNSNQMDMYYCGANSIKELLDFLVSGERSILYKNKLIIIKNPDDSLKLYRIN